MCRAFLECSDLGRPSHRLVKVFLVGLGIFLMDMLRFLAEGTMEEKIYNRQVTKQSLSARVVDD